jgi:hypothetical protein
MRSRSVVLHSAVAALALLPLAGCAHAQSWEGSGDSRVQREAFRWNGPVPAGRWLYLRNVNGPIRVERASGSQVEVVADLRVSGDGDPSEVRFVAQKARDGQGMVVCALWGPRASCDEDGYRGDRDWSERNRRGWTAADFVVRLPEGVRLDLSSVNGSLTVSDATSEVVARTVNGSITAATRGGPVSARTVNGSITARMAAVGDARELDFSSTNGSISVEVPPNVGAEVEMSTVNGRVSTEFPVTISGRIDPRRLNATIGDGSRRLRMRTVNGSVTLRRGG